MSWMNRLRNQMRQESQRAMSQVALPRMGKVTNYDPARYAARVELQPEGILTGYLPVTTIWVGNGWGFYAPPNIGDVVEVHFQQGGKEAGFIVNRFYSAKTKPLSVRSGELWLVHETGSYFKLTNDGKLLQNSTVEIDIGNLAATLHQLVTDAFVPLFNNHTHAHGPVPDQPMGAPQLTAILKAN